MVESADQSLRELERRARNAPKDYELQQSLATHYLRQNKLSEAIHVLQTAELFSPYNPVAQSIAKELKRIQRATLSQLHRETRVWSWPRAPEPETLIPIKELNETSPVILGLLFRENDWATLTNSPDVKLWLHSLSVTQADQYDLPVTEWILSLSHLSQLTIQFSDFQKERAEALLRLIQLQDLQLAVHGDVPDHFFREIGSLMKLKAFTFYGSMSNFEEISL
ncbi:MAG: hypothetical protein P1V97_22715, partial [Planctomycetota bacterium]|nr:hypothetical protein [Planctomycetota bacterium]